MVLRAALGCTLFVSTACGLPGGTAEDAGSSGNAESSSGSEASASEEGSTGADEGTDANESTDPDESTDADESSSGGTDCTAPQILCGEDCVDPDQDELHCGACGFTCAPGQTCVEGVCGCPDGQIACDGQCIDPLEDGNHCGATLDCMGENAGETCSLTGLCDAGACVESCDNCGFEDADFSGWTVVDLLDPFLPATVGLAGTSAPDGESFGFFVGAPPEGTYAAYTGFDGSAGTISIGQDIVVGAHAQAPALVFSYRAAWDLDPEYLSTQDRVFSVSIQPAGGGTPLETIEITTAEAGTTQLDSGPQVRAIDLSSYVGEELFIAFEWFVPETFTGPAFCEIDHVHVEEQR